MQQKNAPKTKTNRHILDLFLAMDLNDAHLFKADGQLIGVNMAMMENEAAVFLSHLGSLGVDDLPSSNDLVQAWREFG